MLLLLLRLKIVSFTLISADDKKLSVIRTDAGMAPALLWLRHSLLTTNAALLREAAKHELHVLPD